MTYGLKHGYEFDNNLFLFLISFVKVQNNCGALIKLSLSSCLEKGKGKKRCSFACLTSDYNLKVVQFKFGTNFFHF